MPLPQETFIYRLPTGWQSLARKVAGPMGIVVGELLWFQAGVCESNVVRVTKRLRDRYAVARRTCYDVFRQMESVGLIQVERKAGRAPVVTIHKTPEATLRLVSGDLHFYEDQGELLN